MERDLFEKKKQQLRLRFNLDSCSIYVPRVRSMVCKVNLCSSLKVHFVEKIAVFLEKALFSILQEDSNYFSFAITFLIILGKKRLTRKQTLVKNFPLEIFTWLLKLNQ